MAGSKKSRVRIGRALGLGFMAGIVGLSFTASSFSLSLDAMAGLGGLWLAVTPLAAVFWAAYYPRRKSRAWVKALEHRGFSKIRQKDGMVVLSRAMAECTLEVEVPAEPDLRRTTHRSNLYVRVVGEPGPPSGLQIRPVQRPDWYGQGFVVEGPEDYVTACLDAATRRRLEVLAETLDLWSDDGVFSLRMSYTESSNRQGVIGRQLDPMLDLCTALSIRADDIPARLLENYETEADPAIALRNLRVLIRHHGTHSLAADALRTLLASGPDPRQAVTVTLVSEALADGLSVLPDIGETALALSRGG